MKIKIFLFLMVFINLCLITKDIAGADLLAGPNYSNCGPKPGLMERMLTNADKIRAKCVESVYEEYLKARDKEVEELSLYAKHLAEETKKVAVKATLLIVDCGVETKRSMNLVIKCRQLNAERNAVLARIDRLMGWDQSFKSKAVDPKVDLLDLPTPPCPTSLELEQIKGIRYYNKKLYQTWERCVNLGQ